MKIKEGSKNKPKINKENDLMKKKIEEKREYGRNKQSRNMSKEDTQKLKKKLKNCCNARKQIYFLKYIWYKK